MTTLKSIMLAGITLAILDGLPPCAQAEPGPAKLPADVTEFVSRRASCSEWSTKAIDPEQISQIEAIYNKLQSLKCFDILNDERSLRQKYASNSEILTSLGTGTSTKFVTRLPVRIAAPPPALDR
jgi:hypothetical protein